MKTYKTMERSIISCTDQYLVFLILGIMPSNSKANKEALQYDRYNA